MGNFAAYFPCLFAPVMEERQDELEERVSNLELLMSQRHSQAGGLGRAGPGRIPEAPRCSDRNPG